MKSATSTASTRCNRACYSKSSSNATSADSRSRSPATRSFSESGQVFADSAVLAGSVVDRLHRSTVNNIRSESFRLKEKPEAGHSQVTALFPRPASLTRYRIIAHSTRHDRRLDPTCNGAKNEVSRGNVGSRTFGIVCAIPLCQRRNVRQCCGQDIRNIDWT